MITEDIATRFGTPNPLWTRGAQAPSPALPRSAYLQRGSLRMLATDCRVVRVLALDCDAAHGEGADLAATIRVTTDVLTDPNDPDWRPASFLASRTDLLEMPS